MVTIAEMFPNWMKNSIGNVLGKRQLNRPTKPPETAIEKVNNVKAAQESVPLPPPKEPVKMGFKGLRSFKHPQNLP